MDLTGSVHTAHLNAHRGILRTDDKSKALTATQWNVPTSARCLQCGALGCTSHKFHMDPEKKRRNEEAVRMNTPFFRQKLLQKFSSTNEEEGFARSRIYERWKDELRQLKVTEVQEWKSFGTFRDEHEARKDLSVAERKRRHAILTAFNRNRMLCDIMQTESGVRRQKEQKYLVVGAHIRDAFVEAMMLIATKEQEWHARSSVGEEQVLMWANLRRIDQECRSCMDTHKRARRMLQESCLNGREDIRLQVRDKFESLFTMLRLGIDGITIWYKERLDLAFEHEAGARSVHGEQEVQRRRVREIMSSHYEETLELLKILANEQTLMHKDETKDRSSLEQDEAFENNNIFLLSQRDLEAAQEQIAAKHTAREAFVQKVFHHMYSIKEDEESSMNQLAAWGKENMERTRQLIVSHARGREQMFERFKDGLAILWEAQREEREALHQQMLIDEDATVRLAAEKRQLLLRFASDAFVEVSKLQVHELDARSAIYTMKAEGQEEVARWMDYKGQERSGIALSEAAHRRQIEEAQSTRRGRIISASDELVSGMQQRVQKFFADCKALERQFFKGRHAIEDEYELIVEVMLRSLEDGLYMCFCDEQAAFRQRFEMKESRSRNEGILTEVRHRDIIYQQMDVERRSFDRQVQLIWEAYCDEIQVHEGSHRQIVERRAFEELEHLRLEARREFYETEELEQTRLKLYFIQRQEYMREEARMLDPFEEPLEEQSMSLQEYRQSIRLNSPTRPSVHNALLCQIEYVSNALSYDVSKLPIHFISFLAGVVDTTNESVLVLKDGLTKVEKETEAVGKMLEKQRAEERAAKEHTEFYEKKLEREKQDFKAKMELEKQCRAKEEMNFRAEEKRLKTKQAALRAVLETNEQLKEKLHAHMSRR